MVGHRKRDLGGWGRGEGLAPMDTHLCFLRGVWVDSRFQLQYKVVVYNINLNNF
jgi:hypothetical protein